MPRETFSGVLVPALTPFHSDLTPDAGRLARFLQFLLAEGADGLAIFGTTSEGNSLTANERSQLIDEIVDAGIPAEKLMPGTGACALPDAVEMTRHAVQAGAGGVLVLPPFYYKNQSDDGFFGYYSEIIQRVGDERLRIYLYHFPQMSAAPVSLSLIARLHGAYPRTVVGLKDSSGDWDITRRIIAEFPDMAIFPSSESRLMDGLPLGAAGCISATANIQAGAIRRLIDAIGTPRADALNEKVCRLRGIFESYPLVSSLKAVVAHDTGDDAWLRTRPPIVAVTPGNRDDLFAVVDSLAERDRVQLSDG